MPEKERLVSLLNNAIDEMVLLEQMSANIHSAEEFVTSLSGLTAFRACGMSLQYITESFVKIRNLYGKEFFTPYSSIPWHAVFGMRNFLSHEYGDIDHEGIFDTIKRNIPDLLNVSRQILSDVENS